MDSHVNPPLRAEALFATILTEDSARTGASNEMINRLTNIEPKTENGSVHFAESATSQTEKIAAAGKCVPNLTVFRHKISRFLGVDFKTMPTFAESGKNNARTYPNFQNRVQIRPGNSRKGPERPVDN